MALVAVNDEILNARPAIPVKEMVGRALQAQSLEDRAKLAWHAVGQSRSYRSLGLPDVGVSVQPDQEAVHREPDGRINDALQGSTELRVVVRAPKNLAEHVQ